MHIATIGRNGIAVGAIGALCLGVGGLGVATAANGGSLILGSSNTATHTTTLTDKSGPVLSLVTKAGKSPLKVNSKGLVKHLNANLLGGVTASTLSSGTTAQIKIDLLEEFGGAHPKGILLEAPTTKGKTPVLVPTTVMSTKALTAGTYQVNATFLAEGAVCWVGTKPTQGAQQYAFAEELNGSVDTSVKVANRQQIHAYCAGVSSDSSSDEGNVLLSAGMNVVRVQHSTTGTALTPKPLPTDTTSPAANPLKP
jgi:hypothetical protein